MRDRLKELQRLAESLVSRAGPMDRSPVREQRAALDALQLLDSLGDTARESVKTTRPATPAPRGPDLTAAPPVAPARPQARPQNAAKPQAPTQAAAAAAASARKAPASPFKNQDLVQALLEYSKRRRPGSAQRSNLIKAEELEGGTPDETSGDFAPMDIPHVEAQPKDGITPRRPLDGGAYPILRDTRDAASRTGKDPTA